MYITITNEMHLIGADRVIVDTIVSLQQPLDKQVSIADDIKPPV